ncbi:hypothetical protein ACEE08_05220 [Staphylococcus rostri]|uniref:Uncharacterized protein n=1 Tax=Staphylococcus rostri TaxID=522262 RepID=A0A2K3YIT6_9STAP|nr:hypothetical protein [Staphylococcus rostri]PNZ25512.1 hypothetical protein CD122_09825 [Staphylococcus rostri]
MKLLELISSQFLFSQVLIIVIISAFFNKLASINFNYLSMNQKSANFLTKASNLFRFLFFSVIIFLLFIASLTDLLTDETLDWLGAHRNATYTYLLGLAFQSVYLTAMLFPIWLRKRKIYYVEVTQESDEKGYYKLLSRTIYNDVDNLIYEDTSGTIYEKTVDDIKREKGHLKFKTELVPYFDMTKADSKRLQKLSPTQKKVVFSVIIAICLIVLFYFSYLIATFWQTDFEKPLIMFKILMTLPSLMLIIYSFVITIRCYHLWFGNKKHDN